MPARGRIGPARRHPLVATAVRSTVVVGSLFAIYFGAPLKAGRLVASFWLVAGLAAVTILVAWQVRSIVRSPYPRLRAVEATCTTLPLFLLLFASAHYLLNQDSPGSYSQPMSRVDSLYFVLTTFATVGYGDITPVSESARVVTMVQMFGDLVFVGVIARIILGAVQAGLARQRATNDGPAAADARPSDGDPGRPPRADDG